MNDVTRELLSRLAESETPEPAVTLVGDLNYDIVCIAPPLEAGRRVVVQERHRCLGGAAGVAACGLARLGARVRLVTCAGRDRDGRELVEELERRGVRVSLTEPGGGDVAGRTAGGGAVDGQTGAATGFSLIVTQAGEPVPRQVATFRGVLEGLSLAARTAGDLLAGAGALYGCNYFILPRLSEEIGELFAAARAAGVLTAYDANAGDGWADPDRLRSLRERIYPHTDVVFLNEDEAGALSGGRSPEQALGELCPASCTLVVKRGPRGALVRHRGRRYRVGAFPALEPVRDTIGAGDSFQACFLYFLLAGVPVEQAALLGTANAASTLLAHGGTAGQLDRAGLRRFLSRYRVLDCGAGQLMVEPRDT